MAIEIQIENIYKVIKSLAARVEALEFLSNVDEKPIPVSYLTYNEFSEKYKFVSGSYLSKFVSDNPEFFKGHAVRRGGATYIDEYYTIEWFYLHSKSSRIVNQFRMWLSHFAPLQKALDVVKARLNAQEGGDPCPDFFNT